MLHTPLRHHRTAAHRGVWLRFLPALLIASVLPGVASQAQDADRIRPYEKNPYYWQYKGQPVLLLGGSREDNLFNDPDGLVEHLDLLAAAGGNYVRNTMSSRDEGNPWPFAQDEVTGLYDLTKMGDEYWRRFERLLELTADRDIIVQIEVFDRFDYAQEPWQRNPFNPRNNVNYTAEESGLPEVIDGHPGQRENPFFRSVPELGNNTALLPFQQIFVDTMLSYSLRHGHVLYCISNETNEAEEWGAYWARYIRRAAEKAGVEVHVTEMWDSWDLSDPTHDRTLNHPELYTYIDISQNNHVSGQAHWNNAQKQRQRIASSPRPINNVKMYGGIRFGGGYAEGLRKLWRNALGGMASARYHRPGEWTSDGPLYGAGLGKEAQAYIRSVRVVMDEVGWPDIEPDLDFVELATDPGAVARTERTHVAYTRSAGGKACMYVNGKEAAAKEIGGDLSSWDAGFRLALGDELSGERPWLGTYHHVSLYNRALSASEIEEHCISGVPIRLDGLQARYAFEEGEGNVVRDVSGLEPALDLRIAETRSVAWFEDGLRLSAPVLIVSEGPAERLTTAVRDSNAFTLEAWITPAEETQTGPARIVTLSKDSQARNFTLGQAGNAYEMRLRTTATSTNGLPALGTGTEADASLAAARSLERDRAVVFVSHGSLLRVHLDQLQQGLRAEWFDPLTLVRHEAIPREDGCFQPPSTDDWVLVLR